MGTEKVQGRLRGAFKIKKRRNAEKGGPVHRKFKKFPSFSLEKFKKRGGGVITFQKSPKFPKVPKFEK